MHDSVKPDLLRPGRVRDFLRDADFRPSAVRGQNFLIDRNVRDHMIAAAGIASVESVLEIGPGLGVLTAPLLARAGSFVAVEKDERLYAWLCKHFEARNNIRFLLGDYLKLATTAPELRQTFDTLVSNLPFSVAARILVHLALSPTPPRRALVTVQKEVALRLAAAAGEREYGLLTVLVGDVYDVQLVRSIAPSCFYPVPAVESAVIGLQRRPIRDEDENFARPRIWLPLLRHAFSRRRKQMPGILANGPWVRAPERAQAVKWLQAVGIPLSARPENIDVAQWRRLAEQCAELVPR